MNGRSAARKVGDGIAMSATADPAALICMGSVDDGLR